MQNRILNKAIKINSARFTAELQTFQYNPVTKKAEAQKGKHDDAITALCAAIYVRDKLINDVPIGADVPKEMLNKIQDDVYQEIKRELFDSSYEDFIEEEISFTSYSNLTPYEEETLVNMYRKNSKLLDEFGW